MDDSFEGEVEQHNGTLRVRMRLCKNGFVTKAFKRDYPISQPNQEVIDDLNNYFSMLPPFLLF